VGNTFFQLQRERCHLINWKRDLEPSTVLSALALVRHFIDMIIRSVWVQNGLMKNVIQYEVLQCEMRMKYGIPDLLFSPVSPLNCNMRYEKSTAFHFERPSFMFQDERCPDRHSYGHSPTVNPSFSLQASGTCIFLWALLLLHTET
jgi:hypothetical protein